MTKPTLCLIGLLLAPTISLANEGINRFLGEAQEYSAFAGTAIERQPGTLTDARLSYDYNDANEQSLSFRFRPENAGQRQTRKRLLNLVAQQVDVEVDRQLNDELAARYFSLLDLLETTIEFQFRQQETRLIEASLRLQRGLAQTQDFDIGELQKSELELADNHQHLELLRRRLARQQQGFGGVALDQLQNFVSDWNNELLDWQEIITGTDDLLQQQLPARAGQIDMDIARLRLQLERNQADSWIEFVEMKWQQQATGAQQVSLGFSIPLGGETLGLGQRVAELNRARLWQRQSSRDFSRRLDNALIELQAGHDQHNRLGAAEQLADRQLSNLQKFNNPVLLIDLERQRLAYRQQIRQNRIRGLRAYIDLLHRLEYLASKPLVNRLTNQPLLP